MRSRLRLSRACKDCYPVRACKCYANSIHGKFRPSIALHRVCACDRTARAERELPLRRVWGPLRRGLSIMGWRKPGADWQAECKRHALAVERTVRLKCGGRSERRVALSRDAARFAR